ncbi:MAG: GNAT family N-acetyltransferase [Smithellaceae bacterium]
MKENATQRQELQVNIREMVEGDIEAIRAIDRKIVGRSRAFTYVSSPNNYLSGELTMSVVAETEGRIVGFLLGQMWSSSYADIAFAQIIGVDPAYLHHHIGTRLMQGFIECSKRRGAESVHAMVRRQDGQMISFLRSMDFIDGEMVELVKPLDR